MAQNQTKTKSLSSQVLLFELAKDNIRVNSVHPGYVATPMTKNMKGSSDFEMGASSITPMGRCAKLEEIACEDTFATANTSRIGYIGKFHSSPTGEPFDL
jgi:NAD(P)-dependent dehydrogenase (short-subunit alcohol dehydrogenase family)